MHGSRYLAMLIALCLSPAAQGIMPHAPSLDGTDPASWFAARDGGNMHIRLGDAAAILVLAPNAVAMPAAAANRSDMVFLSGTVQGQSDSTVRITATATYVRGHVWSGDRHWTIATTDEGTVRAVPDARLHEAVAAIQDTTPGLSAGSDPPQPLAGCRGVPPHALANPAGIATGWPERTYDVAFAVEGHFMTAYPDWEFEASALINDLDGWFSRTLDLRIHPVDLRGLGPDVVNAPDVETQIGQFTTHYESELADLDREAAHLFTGSATGTAAGIASCLGGAGEAHLAYSVSEHREDFIAFGLDVATHLGLKVAAHEMSHVLGARHEYKDCVEAIPGAAQTRAVDACTLMWEETLLMSLEMSALNRLVTRGFAERAHL